MCIEVGGFYLFGKNVQNNHHNAQVGYREKPIGHHVFHKEGSTVRKYGLVRVNFEQKGL